MENKVDEIVDEILSHEQTEKRVKSMRKREDLTDIILEKEQSSISTAQKKKKLLLAAASLVLLFLIFLIISKILSSSSTSDKKSDQEVIKKVQENKTATIIKKDVSKDSSENETDLKFEELVRKLKEQDEKESKEIVKVNDDITPKVTNKEPQKPKKEKIKVANKQKEVTLDKKEIKKPKITITSTPTISKPKKSAKSNTTKNTPTKQKRYSTTISFSNKSGFYIQVGATTKPYPNAALVSKIKANGYSYTTHPITIKGKRFYKILIGPYKTKTQALEKLAKIRSAINPKAYIFYLR